MDYTHYQTEDFVLDERFRQWVLQQQHNTFWQNFLIEHPHKEAEIRQARQIILNIDKEYESLPQEGVEKIRQSIQRRIAAPTAAVRPLYRPSWGIAASLAGVLLVSALAIWWLTRPAMLTYETGFGEVADVRLPDGSAVTLNANSTLYWYTEVPDRQVVLEGEAFFHVRKDHGRTFTVRANDVEVKVLGTSFNVKNRRDQTQVVLRSGSVALRHTPSGEEALMQPGDLVSVTENAPLTRQRVDTESYTAYTEQQLRIDQTSLAELAIIIEDLYGYSVTFEGETLPQRRFTATTEVPLRELDTLLQLIEATFGVGIVQTKDEIIIRD
ncbi:FecR family protein [Tunicatimonas pelagia]|uniref:FecR family protein n=1 Tax=Tunicatimonas pelagia TaxID=931531 RepID=UPI002666A66D|nr:FecR domain-containing protein [Tunicatimonas pelagia]WKN45007.1 FecR domain-containing protein [Tunicatimonas pelagia]